MPLYQVDNKKSICYRNDCQKADEAYGCLKNGNIKHSKTINGVVYIQTDGAALNTRQKDADGSSWRENKLGEVFNSKNIRYWTVRKGRRQHQILKREYISFVGSVFE
jgi:hypothetical protein